VTIIIIYFWLSVILHVKTAIWNSLLLIP
jgi:hypothetical protein